MSSPHERNNQVNVVVTEEQKARWKQHLDPNGAEFQSLSHLIRQVVEKEMSDTVIDSSKPSAPVLDNSEVLDAIRSLSSH